MTASRSASLRPSHHCAISAAVTPEPGMESMACRASGGMPPVSETASLRVSAAVSAWDSRVSFSRTRRWKSSMSPARVSRVDVRPFARFWKAWISASVTSPADSMSLMSACRSEW